MNTRIIMAAAAGAFVLGMQTATAQDASDCGGMLTTSIGMSLDAQGFDTSNVCDLTVSDLTVIKSLIETDGMNSSTRGRIENILEQAGS